MLTHYVSGQSGNYISFIQSEHELLFNSNNVVRLKFQFQTDNVIRVQWVRKGEDFFTDVHYEMVVIGIYPVTEKIVIETQ